jgi:hypothetical protein
MMSEERERGAVSVWLVMYVGLAIGSELGNLY